MIFIDKGVYIFFLYILQLYYKKEGRFFVCLGSEVIYSFTLIEKLQKTHFLIVVEVTLVNG